MTIVLDAYPGPDEINVALWPQSWSFVFTDADPIDVDTINVSISTGDGGENFIKDGSIGTHSSALMWSGSVYSTDGGRTLTFAVSRDSSLAELGFWHGDTTTISGHAGTFPSAAYLFFDYSITFGDAAGPGLLATTPANFATGVLRDTHIQAVFLDAESAIDVSTLTLTLIPYVGGDTILQVVGEEQTEGWIGTRILSDEDRRLTATFTPPPGVVLDALTRYLWQVQVSDVLGNASSLYTRTFWTGLTLTGQAEIPDHCGDGIKRLIAEYRDKPKLEGLICALADPIQGLEDVLAAIEQRCDLDGAVGVQLDELGERIGQPRGGLGDVAYLGLIKARILANKSSGTWEELRAVLAMALFGPTEPSDGFWGSYVQLVPSYPAALVIYAGDGADLAVAEAAARMAQIAKPVGVRVLLEYEPLESGGVAFGWDDAAENDFSSLSGRWFDDDDGDHSANTLEGRWAESSEGRNSL